MRINHPVKKTKTYFCFGYPKDLEQAYSFYCARYKDMSFDEFLHLGISEVSMKLNSIPESEPLYTILKSRSINVNDIKNKDERKHWRKLQKDNAIPDSYLTTNEIMISLNKMTKEKKL